VRVVIVTGIFPPDIGGPATHAHDLAEGLRARGHRVTVLTLTDEPAPVETEGLVRFPRRWPWPVRMAAVTRWLMANRSGHDVVYATGLDLAAIAGARLARRPVVLKVVGDPAWERGRRLGLTDDGFDDFQASTPRRGSTRLAMMRATRDWAVANATVVVAPSAFLRDVVEGWSGRRQTAMVVPNGVKATGGGPGNDPGGEREGSPRLRLVSVGRLVDHKRTDVLLRAVARADDVHLEVVGEGPEMAALTALAAELGVGDRVDFLGRLSHDDTMGRLAAADALVSATAYEGLPHTVIEALVCGTPVVTTPAGGVVEAVEHEVNALLVDPGDATGFAAAFERLRSEPGLLTSLGKGAAESGTGWHFDRCLDTVEGLLRGLAGDRPRAVYLGRALSWPPGHEVRRKLAVHARHLRQISIGSGPAGLRRVSGTRVLLLPGRSKVGARLSLYGLGPAAAVVAAAGRDRSVIVCQSPYEGLGVAVLRGLIPRKRRPRLQIELHGDWRTASRLYGSPRRKLVAPAADRVAAWALRRADRVRVVSQSLERMAREAGYTGPVDRHVTYSEFELFMRTPVVAPPDRPRAVFIGVLERYKAVDILLRAWSDVVATLPEAELTVVGKGSLGGVLRDQAGAAGLSVRFVDPVSQAELVDILDRATCLVLPSRSEGLPRIVLEAMARARPVVATDVGGMAELVDDATGRLIPPEDRGALVRALLDVLGDLPAAAAMGSSARVRAEARRPAEEYEAGIARLASWAAAGRPSTRPRHQ